MVARCKKEKRTFKRFQTDRNTNWNESKNFSCARSKGYAFCTHEGSIAPSPVAASAATPRQCLLRNRLPPESLGLPALSKNRRSRARSRRVARSGLRGGSASASSAGSNQRCAADRNANAVISLVLVACRAKSRHDAYCAPQKKPRFPVFVGKSGVPFIDRSSAAWNFRNDGPVFSPVLARFGKVTS
jgi:hypothetical protein